MCNVQIEKQYGFIAMHQHGTDHSCQGCTLEHLRPHTHTQLIHHHSPQHCPQAEKHEKMWTFFVLILLEIRNSAIIAGIQRLFQGNFKHFMVLLVLFFQRQKFRWCKYFCFFHVYHCLKSYCKCKSMICIFQPDEEWAPHIAADHTILPLAFVTWLQWSQDHFTNKKKKYIEDVVTNLKT